MKILDLISFIDERVPFTYYPNDFPVNAVDACAAVTLTSGFPVREWTGVRRPSFQVRVRGNYDETTGVTDVAGCEAKAYEIHDALTNLHEVTIGDDSVVAIRAMNSVPMYLGDDDNYRPIYSMNFATVTRP